MVLIPFHPPPGLSDSIVIKKEYPNNTFDKLNSGDDRNDKDMIQALKESTTDWRAWLQNRGGQPYSPWDKEMQDTLDDPSKMYIAFNCNQRLDIFKQLDTETTDTYECIINFYLPEECHNLRAGAMAINKSAAKHVTTSPLTENMQWLEIANDFSQSLCRKADSAHETLSAYLANALPQSPVYPFLKSATRAIFELNMKSRNEALVCSRFHRPFDYFFFFWFFLLDFILRFFHVLHTRSRVLNGVSMLCSTCSSSTRAMLMSST